MTDNDRNASKMRRLRAFVRKRDKDLPCYRCQQPIDQRLKYPNPDSWSLEHKQPWTLAPHLRYDPANCTGSHLHCNRQAQADPTPLSFTTSRDW